MVYHSSKKFKWFKSRSKNHTRTYLCDLSHTNCDENRMNRVIRIRVPEENQESFRAIWFKSSSFVIWIKVLWFKIMKHVIPIRKRRNDPWASCKSDLSQENNDIQNTLSKSHFDKTLSNFLDSNIVMTWTILRCKFWSKN